MLHRKFPVCRLMEGLGFEAISQAKERKTQEVVDKVFTTSITLSHWVTVCLFVCLFYHFCVSLPLFLSENISAYVHTLYLSLLLTLSTILNQLSWRQVIFLLLFTAQSS